MHNNSVSLNFLYNTSWVVLFTSLHKGKSQGLGTLPAALLTEVMTGPTVLGSGS